MSDGDLTPNQLGARRTRSKLHRRHLAWWSWFSGQLSILVADEDICPHKQFLLKKVPLQSQLVLTHHQNPEFTYSLFLLTQTGSEHLPQISLGKVWVLTIQIESLDFHQLRSVWQRNAIISNPEHKYRNGRAIVFVVDEGIHALTNYENKSPNDHYLSERALNYGIMTNFGELISQDLALSLQSGWRRWHAPSAAAAISGVF